VRSRCFAPRARLCPVLLHDLLAFGNDTLDRLAGLTAGSLAQKLEYLFKALDLFLRLVAVLQEARPCLLQTARHAPSSAKPSGSAFCKIDILERIKKKILQCLLAHSVLLLRE
jgi:hypothetical protein